MASTLTFDDWSNLGSTNNVIGDTNRITIWQPGHDNFDDKSSGDATPSYYTDNGGLTGIEAGGSPNAPNLGIDGGGYNAGIWSPNFDADGSTVTVSFRYKEGSNDGGFAFSLLNSNGNLICEFGTANPEVGHHGGSGSVCLVSSPDPNYGEWREFEVTLDFPNNSYDITWKDITGNTTSSSSTGNSFDNGASGIYDIQVGETDNTWCSARPSLPGRYMDQLWGSYRNVSGYGDSPIKSFSNSQTPDLQNLDYDLNGSDATLTVYGSPGTASEETNQVTLDGSTSYSLSWSSSHTDFKVRPDMTSRGRAPSNKPVVRSVELKGATTVTETGVFTDATANPSTTSTSTKASESNVFTNSTASTLSPSTFASTTIGATETGASALPFATEEGSTTIGAITTDAVATSFVTDSGIATESGVITDAVVSPFATERGVANETGIYTESAASTITISPFTRAFESGVYTNAAAQISVIDIPPIPRMGLDVTETDGELHHGVEDWDT